MYANIVGNILKKINHEVTMFSLIWERIYCWHFVNN